MRKDRAIFTVETGIETTCERCFKLFYGAPGHITKYCLDCVDIVWKEQQDERKRLTRKRSLDKDNWGRRSLTLLYDPSPEGERFQVGSLHSRTQVLDELRIGEIWQEGTRFRRGDHEEVVMHGHLVDIRRLTDDYKQHRREVDGRRYRERKERIYG